MERILFAKAKCTKFFGIDFRKQEPVSTLRLNRFFYREGLTGKFSLGFSVRFRSKERPRNAIFGFVAPFVARSLTPVPCSLLLNCTETLAAQAIEMEYVKSAGFYATVHL